MSYFRSKNWPEEWVDAARSVLREHWSLYYKPRKDLDHSSQPSESSSTSRDNFFDELDDFGTDPAIDELEEYLNTPTISTKGLEPLTWWYAIGDSNPLARMAIDFLSAPGKPIISFNKFLSNLYLASSCDVERGFSRGGLTVSKLRHRLSDESTRASTVLHAWSEIPGLIPESEIIQVFQDKSHRLNTENESGKEIISIGE